MKLSVFVICCVIVTLQYEPVKGGLVKDFFGQVHETAQHVREDVRNTLHLNGKDDKKDPDETDKQKNEAPQKENKNENDVKPEEGSKETEGTSLKETEKKDEGKKVEPGQNAKEPETKTEDKPKDEVAGGASPKDDKDGKENFTGACASGYVRTVDGRCKPSF